MGYRGWVASHGFEGVARGAQLVRMQREPNATELFDSAGVRFVYSRGDSGTHEFTDVGKSAHWKTIPENASHRVWTRRL
jgi:hypothetical protein